MTNDLSEERQKALDLLLDFIVEKTKDLDPVKSDGEPGVSDNVLETLPYRGLGKGPRSSSLAAENEPEVMEKFDISKADFFDLAKYVVAAHFTYLTDRLTVPSTILMTRYVF